MCFSLFEIVEGMLFHLSNVEWTETVNFSKEALDQF